MEMPGEAPMERYRLYCLGEDGAISLAEWIDAIDDEDAIRKAHKVQPRALKCEVWQKKAPSGLARHSRDGG